MYGKKINFLQKNNSKFSDFVKKSTMIIAQKVFILLVFVMFLCIINLNNVYAKTVTLNWDSAPLTLDSVVYSRIYDLDFSQINSVSVTATMNTHKENRPCNAYAYFRAYDTHGNILASDTVTYYSCIPDSKNLILNLSSIKCEGYLECQYKGDNLDPSGYLYPEVYMSIGNVTAQYNDKPKFNANSYVQSNGNLTHFKI